MKWLVKMPRYIVENWFGPDSTFEKGEKLGSISIKNSKNEDFSLNNAKINLNTSDSKTVLPNEFTLSARSETMSFQPKMILFHSEIDSEAFPLIDDTFCHTLDCRPVDNLRYRNFVKTRSDTLCYERMFFFQTNCN